MGLREKVTLVLIAVVLYKTVCSLCVQQSVKENIFEKYLNKLKHGKSKTVSKYEIEQNQKSQKLQDDYHKQNVLKTYSFPEVDFPSDNSPKVNPVGISSIDVLSDSAFLNELRKEKRRKRKNKQTEKTYSRDDTPVATVPGSFRNQEPTTYFTEMGSFPEVQYPLTAADTWSKTFWNPLPSDKEDDHIKSNHFRSQNKKQLKKDIEAFLKPTAVKQNQGIFKGKYGSTKINLKNVTNIKDQKIFKEELESIPIKTIDNTKTSKNQPQKFNDTTIPPVIGNKKLKSLKNNISEAQLPSKKHSNISKKVISKSTSSRSKSTLFPRVTQLSNKTNNVCSSDNITSCVNSKKANAINSSSKEDSISDIQKIELLNNVSLDKIDLENMDLENFIIVDYNEKPIEDVPLLSLADTTPTLALEDMFSKENVKNDQSREIISEVLLDDITEYPNNDYFVKNPPKEELLEKNPAAPLDSTHAGNISNDTHDIDSTKMPTLLTDMDSESPVESYPAYPTSSLRNLQSNEVSDYPVSLNDDSVRQRIIDVLSTEKASVSSLRENILKILLTEEQLPNEIISESQLNEFNANEEISESPSTYNLFGQNMIEIPETVSPLTKVIDSPSLSQHPLRDEFLSVSLPSEDIVELPITVADYSGKVISESPVINTVSDIIPEETKPISNDTIEVLPMVSKDSTEVGAEPIISEAFADNLREIISKPSNSRALVDDLREIIRLLTIWNSQIDDSNEIINHTSGTVTSADNWTEIPSDLTGVITYDLSVKDKPTEDLIILVPDINDLHSRMPTTDSIQMVSEVIADENDKFDQKSTNKPMKHILESTSKDNPEDSASELIITSKLDNKPLSEDPPDDSSAIITVSLTKEIENITTDSSAIILDSTDSKKYITSTEKHKSDSHEIIPESATNDVNDTLTVILAIDSNETISEVLNSDKDKFADLSEIITDRVTNKSTTVFSKVTTDSSEIIHDLSAKDKQTKKIMTESEDILSDSAVENTKSGSTKNIAKDITDDLKHNDWPADDSNSGAYTFEPAQTADEIIPVFKFDKALTDDVSETIPNKIHFSEFPSTLTVGDIISSLARDTESDIPISFVSTNVPSPDKILFSIPNQTENSIVTNPVAEIHIPKVDEYFENICPIIDENSLKNQCFIFEDPDYFNSTSNLTDIITGKQLLTTVEEPIGDPLSKLKLTNVTLTDLIMGHEYTSNHTAESQNKTASLNVSDTATFISDDEIPDFSDYASLPEDDTNSDFVDNTLFNVNETCSDQFSSSVYNTSLNSTDVTASNKVQNQSDISYTFNESGEPTDDPKHIKSDAGTPCKSIQYETIPENVSKESATERDVAPKISYESTTDTVSNKFAYNFVPEDSNTEIFNDTACAITPDEAAKVSTYYIDHITDSEKVDESDTSNEYIDNTTSVKSKTGSIHESTKYDTVPLDFTADISYEPADVIVPDEPNIDTLDPTIVNSFMSNSSRSFTDESDIGIHDKSAEITLEKSGEGLSHTFLEDDTAPEEFYAYNEPAAEIIPNIQPNKVLDESVFDRISNKFVDSDFDFSAKILTDSDKDDIGTVFNDSKVTVLAQGELGTITDDFIPHGKTDELTEEIVSNESNTDKTKRPADEIEPEQSDFNTSNISAQTTTSFLSTDTSSTESNQKRVADDFLDDFYGSGDSDFYGSGDSETLRDETHVESTFTSNIPSDEFDSELSEEFIFEKALDTTNAHENAKDKPSTLALHESETDQISFKPTDIIAIDEGNDSTRELTNDITEPDESENRTRLNDSTAAVSSEQNKNYLLLDEPGIDRSILNDAELTNDLDADLNPDLQLDPYKGQTM